MPRPLVRGTLLCKVFVTSQLMASRNFESRSKRRLCPSYQHRFVTQQHWARVLYPKFTLVSIVNSKCTSCVVIYLEEEKEEM